MVAQNIHLKSSTTTTRKPLRFPSGPGHGLKGVFDRVFWRVLGRLSVLEKNADMSVNAKSMSRSCQDTPLYVITIDIDIYIYIYIYTHDMITYAAYRICIHKQSETYARDYVFDLSHTNPCCNGLQTVPKRLTVHPSILTMTHIMATLCTVLKRIIHRFSWRQRAFVTTVESPEYYNPSRMELHWCIRCCSHPSPAIDSFTTLVPLQ